MLNNAKGTTDLEAPSANHLEQLKMIEKAGSMGRINTHPGEVLREEFLIPFGRSARSLVRELGVPPNRTTGILNEARDVTADTGYSLG